VEEARQKRAHNRVFRLEIVCQGCGVTVVGSSEKRKYCSRQCGNKHRAEEIRAYHREYHRAHSDKKNARSRRFREENYETNRERRLLWYQGNREEVLMADKSRRYGFTKEKYLSELGTRNGLCDLCGEPQLPNKHGKVPVLVVDHDHVTGAVRGFLCSRCNLALGGFRDNVEIMTKAIEYIQREGRIATS